MLTAAPPIIAAHMTFARVLLVFLPAFAGCGVADMIIVEKYETPGPTCEPPSECVPLAPLGWSDPVLLWAGGWPTSVACPAEAPIVAWEGYTDLDVPHECTPCKCEPPHGTCTLPTEITAHAGACVGGNGFPTPFDAPAGWDGSCVLTNPIPALAPCPGGLCVQSVTVAPVVATQGPPCKPMEAESTVIGTPLFKRYALACRSNVNTFRCDDPGTACMPDVAPTAEAPDKWVRCVHREGEHTCPDDYSAPFVAYEVGNAAEYDDTRACTTCACTEPSGSTCEAQVTLYNDAACTASLAMMPIASDGPKCFDLPAGKALFGKSATGPVYTPGQCSPIGGMPVGGVTPNVPPSTFCCYTPPG